MGLSYSNSGIVKNSGHTPNSQHQKGQRGVLKLRDGTKKSNKLQLFTRTCIKPTNKLVSSLFGAPLVLGQATANSGLTKLITAQIQKKPPPSPIQYSLHLSTAPTSEWLFVLGFPRKSPKTIPVWTFGTLRNHNSLPRPLIKMRSETNLQLSSTAF